jgi:hypothetical protein
MPNSNSRITIPYKLLLLLLLCILVGLVVARVVMAVAIGDPGEHQIECMRDLVRWIELILAAFLGLIAGKAAK